MHALPRHPLASRTRRLLSLAYEILIWLALVLVAGFIFMAVARDDAAPLKRHLLQLWVVAVTFAYFAWFWTHGGQTLPMKAWRIRLVAADGRPVGCRRALCRCALAACLPGIGWLWCWLDPERQFLHDRLAGTRIVDVNAAARPPA